MTEIALWEDAWDVINEEFTPSSHLRSLRPHPTRCSDELIDLDNERWCPLR